MMSLICFDSEYGKKLKEKKRYTTTFCGVVVVNDKEALIRRLLDYYNNNTTQKTFNYQSRPPVQPVACTAPIRGYYRLSP